MDRTILIVDDEKDMRIMLKRYFELSGYLVHIAGSGVEALAQAGKQPDLILLDTNMPDLDGLEVCRRIRDHVSCPILFLTARVEGWDKLIGFAAGGDDYIVKPFSIDELGARVDAHLRREERRQIKQVRARFDEDFTIDYSAKEVYFKGTLIPLLPREFEIVQLLSSYPGQLFSKERIFEHIWNIDSDADVGVIMVHMSKIRAKFAKAGTKPYIQTVWGSGYKWVK